MDKIKELKQEIQEIEDSIPQEASKEELYDILVIAYYKAKDIIELYNEVNVQVQQPIDTSELEAEIQELKDQVEIRNNTLSNIHKELDLLTS